MIHRARSGVAIAVARALSLSAFAAIPVVSSAQALEEVVVTAERRETQLQDTPISIVAISGEALEAKGVEDLMDLSDFTPNLSIKGGRTGGNNAPVFSIRGIGGGGGATGERASRRTRRHLVPVHRSVFKVFVSIALRCAWPAV